MPRIVPYWLVPVLALGLTMLAFAEGAFDALPPPPVEAEPGEALAEADRLYRDGHVTLALSHLQRAAGAIGETSTILVGMARCNFRLGRYRDAERNLGDAVEVRLRELGYDPDHIRKVLRKRARDVREPTRQGAQSVQRHLGLSATLGHDRPTNATDEPPQPSPAEMALAANLSDTVLSVVLTDLARVELARAAQWSSVRGAAAPSWLPASAQHREALPEPHREADRRRQRARRLLQGALHAAPHNPDARRLWRIAEAE